MKGAKAMVSRRALHEMISEETLSSTTPVNPYLFPPFFFSAVHLPSSTVLSTNLEVR